MLADRAYDPAAAERAVAGGAIASRPGCAATAHVDLGDLYNRRLARLIEAARSLTDVVIEHPEHPGDVADLGPMCAPIEERVRIGAIAVIADEHIGWVAAVAAEAPFVACPGPWVAQVEAAAERRRLIRAAYEVVERLEAGRPMAEVAPMARVLAGASS